MNQSGNLKQGDPVLKRKKTKINHKKTEKNFSLQELESFTTSKTDRHLLRQKVCQKISVIITNTCVFVVFKTKRELKCQNELFF